VSDHFQKVPPHVGHANDGSWVCECGTKCKPTDHRCPDCRIIHVRVSHLESFRYWHDSEDLTQADLLARLNYTSETSREMEAGKAFAAMMEVVEPPPVDMPAKEATIDGWRFVFEYDGTLEVPAVRELEARMVLHTRWGVVLLTGHCDGLDGVTVHDQKLTRRWDAEKYIDSLQWRSYLAMFGGSRFVYDVFVGKYDDAGGTNTVTIVDYHRLPLFAYEGMRGDVIKAVGRVAEVIATHLSL
jgi:hypothetical protein